MRATPLVTYHLEDARPLSRFNPRQIALLEKLNHADPLHLARLGRIVVPDQWNLDPLAYSPMPSDVPEIASEPQAIVVDLPAQVFGAYESGKLVRWGPVSSGGPDHPTPSGIYHLKWKARRHISTIDATWIMPYYCKFSNRYAIGLHEYGMPGRPASHGCVRLLECDAQWIFRWGRAAGNDGSPGTPVLVVGQYNYRAPQPWLQPEWWATGVQPPLNGLIASD